MSAQKEVSVCTQPLRPNLRCYHKLNVGAFVNWN